MPLLLEHFLRHFSKENDKPLRRFTPAALKLLVDYDWPGNVRELENVVERAVVLSTQELMDVDLLPESVRTQEVIGGVRLQLSEFMPPLPGEAGSRAGADSSSPSLFQIMEEFERRVISDMLERTGVEPDRGRRTIPDSAFDAQSEDQAAGNRSAPPQGRR